MADKPLIRFVIDRHGLIKSKGKLQDEWLLIDKYLRIYKSLSDLHYRTMECIWKDALNWVNKDLL